jgi:hypothetical protein
MRFDNTTRSPTPMPDTTILPTKPGTAGTDPTGNAGEWTTNPTTLSGLSMVGAV